MPKSEFSVDKGWYCWYNTCIMARSGRNAIAKWLKESEWLLGATLVRRYLKCGRKQCEICLRQGGHGPAYYLSLRGAEGRTRMVYVPRGSLSEARRGIAAWKRIKRALRRLGGEEVERWRREKRR